MVRHFKVVQQSTPGTLTFSSTFFPDVKQSHPSDKNAYVCASLEAGKPATTADVLVFTDQITHYDRVRAASKWVNSPSPTPLPNYVVHARAKWKKFRNLNSSSSGGGGDLSIYALVHKCVCGGLWVSAGVVGSGGGTSEQSRWLHGFTGERHPRT